MTTSTFLQLHSASLNQRTKACSGSYQQVLQYNVESADFFPPKNAPNLLHFIRGEGHLGKQKLQPNSKFPSPQVTLGRCIQWANDLYTLRAIYTNNENSSA
jgi:hypothetical protein